jgi:hypothetical protein
MPAADEQSRPDPHACCPNARTYLRTYSFVGTWSWKFTGSTGHVPVIFCPWCGVALPKERSAKLSIVRTSD